MKKLLCLVAGILTVISCAASDKEMPISDTAPAPAAPLPDPAYYSDWDSAIRYDSDMQNMYANTPTKIEKPIDMYMTMALALKYNYSGRMARYQENLVKAGKSTYSALPEIVSKAGYVNTNYSDTSPDLKVTWNILDLSTLNFMNRDPALRQSIATEESRKVIQNILQVSK